MFFKFDLFWKLVIGVPISWIIYLVFGFNLAVVTLLSLILKVDNIDIYETIEEAESKLFEYLKRGTCCWIVNCNG